MKIESLSQLRKIIRLCRREGVNVMKIDGIEMVLEGHPEGVKEPIKAPLAPFSTQGITEDTKIETPEQLTSEQLLFYSAGGQQ